jgi:DNA replication protein DnaC
MPKTTKRQAEVCELREQLNLGGMAAIFAEVALRAATEHLTHEASVWELAAHERDLRTQRRTARLLRASGLPTEKTFHTCDLRTFPSIIQVHVERLKSGTFLESATNVVAVGRPGVGKSHVLAA